MATASQTLDTARLLNRQRKETQRAQSGQGVNVEPPAITRANEARYTPKEKDENALARFFRNRRNQSRTKAAVTSALPVNPMHLATARGLQASWLAVFGGFVSLGTSTFFGLLYLNAHLMGRVIAPSVFARFGTEWIPVKNRSLRGVTKTMEGLEIATLLFVDFIIVMILVFILSLLVAIGYGLSLIAEIPAWVSNVINFIGISNIPAPVTNFIINQFTN